MMVSSLRSIKITIVAILALTLLFGAAANFAWASGPDSGYVQYKVTVSSQESSIKPVSATINETVQPSSQSGFIYITLTVSSDAGNFSYSKNVKASSLPETFPYLSGLTTQSLSYQAEGFSITATLNNTGQTPITFNGTSYQATKYLVSFSVTNSSATSFSGNGTILSLPSGLIDTIQLSVNQTAMVNVALLSTDLSLNAPTTGVNPLGASLLGVALVVAVAIAGPTIYKKTKDEKNKKQTRQDEAKSAQEGEVEKENEEEKPSYWVD